MLMFSRSNDLFNPFSSWTWEVIGAFMIIQPIFFLGGAWFRSARWFKTIISVFILAAGLGLLACFTFVILFAGELHGLFQGTGIVLDGQGLDWTVNSDLFEGVHTGLKILFYALAPPFCCYLTWLRVRETQVSHGI